MNSSENSSCLRNEISTDKFDFKSNRSPMITMYKTQQPHDLLKNMCLKPELNENETLTNNLTIK